MKRFLEGFKTKMAKAFNKIKCCFKSASMKIKKSLAPLMTLVMMQFKDKLTFSFKADKKGALIKLFLYIVLFAALIAVLAVVFFVLSTTSIFEYNCFPIYHFNFFFIILFVISIVTCLIGFTNSLYFSPDNPVLLTYPVKANTVFISKMIVYYLFELIKNFGYLLPLFIAYGIANKFQVGYYFWLVFCFFFISMLPVAIAAFLSIIVMQIKMFFRNHPLIENLVFILILIGAVGGLFYAISLLPRELRISQEWSYYKKILADFSITFGVVFLPIEFLSRMLIGYTNVRQSPLGVSFMNSQTVIIFFIMIGIIIALIVFAMLIVRPLFFKVASRPFEYKRKIIKHFFDIPKSDLKYEFIFEPVGEFKNESRRDRLKRLRYTGRFIDKLKKEESTLIKNNHVYSSKILKLINKYSGHLKFRKADKDNGVFVPGSFGVVSQNGVCHLVMLLSESGNKISCYDPHHLSKKNHVKKPIISSFVKDSLVDLRSTSSLFNTIAAITLPGLLAYLLNRILCALNLKLDGQIMTIMFTLMVVLLILLSINISVASIYSKEGQSSYLLKAAPVNYMKALSTKLIGKTIIGTLSVVVAVLCIYFACNSDTYSHVSYDYVCLAFMFLFLFIGHMLWSAELDYMNPQENLYDTSGETRSVSNSSEAYSSIFGLLTIVVFCLIAFFLLKENILSAFAKLTIIAALYLVARVILFSTKISAYKTSRSERR